MTLKGSDLTRSTTKAFYNILKHYLSTHEDWHHHPKSISASMHRGPGNLRFVGYLSAENIDPDIQYPETDGCKSNCAKISLSFFNSRIIKRPMPLTRIPIRNWDNQIKDSNGNRRTKKHIKRTVQHVLLTHRCRWVWAFPTTFLPKHLPRGWTELPFLEERVEFSSNGERRHIISPNGIHICIIMMTTKTNSLQHTFKPKAFTIVLVHHQKMIAKKDCSL